MQPFLLRDFSRGVYRLYSVNTFLVPKNSVSGSVNINYDTIIGSAVVRPGTTLIGSAVASNKIPLGLTNFLASGGATNLLVAVFSGTSTASIYYFDTAWHTSTVTNLNNTAKNRFSTFGNLLFRANGVNAMTSSPDGNTWSTADCITTDSVIPSILLVSQDRMIASGYSGFRSRVYFSSIIDPNSATFLTWNTDPSTGDWIDINPDDGGYITGFANTSTITLIFKNNGMYRTNIIQQNTDANNIFNIGAVSQESIVTCQGVVYFFSGIDIRQTQGDYPTQISRLGVQDFIDAIPQANWTSVAGGTDGLNVYFSIGNVTLNVNTDDQATYTNVVLKFSPRDQTWSIHSYAQLHTLYSEFTTPANGFNMIEADTTGSVQTFNLGQTDNGTPIYYEVVTQEIEQKSRATNKIMSNQLVVYTKYGQDSKIQIKSYTPNEGNWEEVKMSLSDRVNVATCNAQGEFFKFRWYGSTSGQPPVLEGIEVPAVKDEGVILNQ